MLAWHVMLLKTLPRVRVAGGSNPPLSIITFNFMVTKAILFDSGGVLINQTPLVNSFIKIFKPGDKEEFFRQLNLQAIPLCKGEITEGEYWSRMASLFGKKRSSINNDLWTKDFETLTHVDNQLLTLIKILKKKYLIGMITNSIESHVDINRKRGLYSLFDITIFSHEVGMTKDTKDIFLLVASKLRVMPEECLFVDDLPEFVEVAQSTGMKGIVFKDASSFKRELNTYLGQVRDFAAKSLKK